MEAYSTFTVTARASTYLAGALKGVIARSQTAKLTASENDKTMMTNEDIVQQLAGGAVIRATDEGDGYSYELVTYHAQLPSSQIVSLLDKGWIESMNTVYRLSDEGKKAYLRSTR